MIIEIITDGKKCPVFCIFQPDGREIILRTCNRNKYINQIIDKKRSNQYKRKLFEQLEPVNEIKQCNYQNHRIIRKIA